MYFAEFDIFVLCVSCSAPGDEGEGEDGVARLLRTHTKPANYVRLSALHTRARRQSQFQDALESLSDPRNLRHLADVVTGQ